MQLASELRASGSLAVNVNPLAVDYLSPTRVNFRASLTGDGFKVGR